LAQERHTRALPRPRHRVAVPCLPRERGATSRPTPVAGLAQLSRGVSLWPCTGWMIWDAIVDRPDEAITEPVASCPRHSPTATARVAHARRNPDHKRASNLKYPRLRSRRSGRVPSPRASGRYRQGQDVGGLDTTARVSTLDFAESARPNHVICKPAGMPAYAPPSVGSIDFRSRSLGGRLGQGPTRLPG